MADFKRIPNERSYNPENTLRLSALKYKPSLEESLAHSQRTDVEMLAFLMDLEREYATQDMDRIREWYKETFPEELPGQSDHVPGETTGVEARDIFDDLF